MSSICHVLERSATFGRSTHSRFKHSSRAPEDTMQLSYRFWNVKSAFILSLLWLYPSRFKNKNLNSTIFNFAPADMSWYDWKGGMSELAKPTIRNPASKAGQGMTESKLRLHQTFPQCTPLCSSWEDKPRVKNSDGRRSVFTSSDLSSWASCTSIPWAGQDHWACLGLCAPISHEQHLSWHCCSASLSLSVQPLP